MNLTERMTKANDLWSRLLPDIPLPPERTLAAWLTNFKGDAGDRAFEDALAHAPYRVEKWKQKGQLIPDRVYRYVTTYLHQAHLNHIQPTNLDRLLDEVDEAVANWKPTPRRDTYVLDLLYRVARELRTSEDPNHVMDKFKLRTLAVSAVDAVELDNQSNGDPEPPENQTAVARLTRAVEGR